MTVEQYRSTLQDNHPPPVSIYLKALWYDKKGDWASAHNVAQDIPDNYGSWIHAYLHRKEGDLSNAGYWYRKAGKPMPGYSLEKEWDEMVKELHPL